MEALLFLVVMVAALLVAAVVIGRGQRGPSPDAPNRSATGEETTDVGDPRDRPAGPAAEFDRPHDSEMEPGD